MLNSPTAPAHSEPSARVRCVGTFRIRRGPGPMARLLARLLRLPPDADDVPTTLRIIKCGRHEKWERGFDNYMLCTTQRTLADGSMVEQFRFLELRYRTDRRHDSAHHVQTSAAVRCGPLLVPLPRWLAPQVKGIETATAIAGQVRVQVDVQMPVIGELLSYDGIVTMLEAWP